MELSHQVLPLAPPEPETAPTAPTAPTAQPIGPPELVVEPSTPIALLVEKVKAGGTWAEVESVWNGDEELKSQIKSQLSDAEYKRVGKLYKKAQSESATSELASEPEPPTQAVDSQSHQLNLLPEFKPPLDSDGRFSPESEDWL